MIKKNTGSSIAIEVWKVLEDYWIILYRVPNVFGRQFLKLWDLIDKLDLVYVQKEFLARQYLFCKVGCQIPIAWTIFLTMIVKEISQCLAIWNLPRKSRRCKLPIVNPFHFIMRQLLLFLHLNSILSLKISGLRTGKTGIVIRVVRNSYSVLLCDWKCLFFYYSFPFL